LNKAVVHNWSIYVFCSNSVVWFKDFSRIRKSGRINSCRWLINNWSLCKSSNDGNNFFQLIVEFTEVGSTVFVINNFLFDKRFCWESEVFNWLSGSRIVFQ
jgi:hypothetical protein